MIKKIFNFFFLVGSMILSKKLLKLFLYLVYVFFAVLVIIYFLFYRPYIKKIKTLETVNSKNYKMNIFENISPKTVDDVGYIDVGKKSTFNNFPKEKKDGVIRIGAFGDSYTYGSEVNDISDFPTILGEIFKNYGCDNVEVLNFGVSGHGGHQSIRIWELEGREYNLDFILFGPEGFQMDRDLIFNYLSMSGPYNIHGRYILKDNKEVEFIGPLGGLDLEERFEAYHSFIPKLRYLLYDKNPPAILKSLMKENKTIDNPFYYYKDNPEKEYQKIYDILFKHISDEEKQIFFVQHKDMFFPEFKKKNSNININYFPGIYNNFFFAPNRHHGSISNNLLSQVYFDLLTGAEKQKVLYLKTYFNEIEDIKKKDLINFSEISDITIDFDNTIISSFLANNKEDLNGGEYPVFLEEIYGNKEIKSFLTIKGNNHDAWSSLFLPLDFNIKDDMEMKFVYYMDSGEKKEKKIGKLKSIDNSIGFVKINFDIEERFNFKKRGGDVHIKEIIKNSLEYDKVKEGFIYLGDEKIYFGEKWNETGNNNFTFFPVKYDHYLFRQNSNPPALMDNYEDQGDVFLSFRHEDAILERKIIGQWKKEETENPMSTENIKYKIIKESGVCKIIKN